MAKIFLDTNYLIDALHRKPEEQILELLEDYIVYISNLSIHIYCYAFKIRIPNTYISEQIERFQMVDFSEEILKRALKGPTFDLEDNIQLHSAVEADCDIFLTEDKRLLRMKFFGKIKINHEPAV